MTSLINQKQEMQNQLLKLQRAHEIEMRNIKILAKTYAVEYFKSKGSELTTIFTNETF